MKKALAFITVNLVCASAFAGLFDNITDAVDKTTKKVGQSASELTKKDAPDLSALSAEDLYKISTDESYSDKARMATIAKLDSRSVGGNGENADARFYLGNAYSSGIQSGKVCICQKDTQKAVQEWKASANAKYTPAILKLGEYFSTNKDYNSALGYLLPAAENGNNEAVASISSIFLTGFQVENDPSLHLRYVTVAAKGGNTGAQFYLTERAKQEAAKKEKAEAELKRQAKLDEQAKQEAVEKEKTKAELIAELDALDPLVLKPKDLTFDSSPVTLYREYKSGTPFAKIIEDFSKQGEVKNVQWTYRFPPTKLVFSGEHIWGGIGFEATQSIGQKINAVVTFIFDPRDERIARYSDIPGMYRRFDFKKKPYEKELSKDLLEQLSVISKELLAVNIVFVSKDVNIPEQFKKIEEKYGALKSYASKVSGFISNTSCRYVVEEKIWESSGKDCLVQIRQRSTDKIEIVKVSKNDSDYNDWKEFVRQQIKQQIMIDPFYRAKLFAGTSNENSEEQNKKIFDDNLQKQLSENEKTLQAETYDAKAIEHLRSAILSDKTAPVTVKEAIAMFADRIIKPSDPELLQPVFSVTFIDANRAGKILKLIGQSTEQYNKDVEARKKAAQEEKAKQDEADKKAANDIL